MFEHYRSAFHRLKVMLPCSVVPCFFGVGLCPQYSRFGRTLTRHSRDQEKQEWDTREAHCKPAFPCTKSGWLSLLHSQEPNIAFPQTRKVGRLLSWTAMASRFPLSDNCHCIHSNLLARNSIQHQLDTAWQERLHSDVLLLIVFNIPKHLLAVPRTMSAGSHLVALPFAGLAPVLWRLAGSLPLHCAWLLVSADAGL